MARAKGHATQTHVCRVNGPPSPPLSPPSQMPQSSLPPGANNSSQALRTPLPVPYNPSVQRSTQKLGKTSPSTLPPHHLLSGCKEWVRCHLDSETRTTRQPVDMRWIRNKWIGQLGQEYKSGAKDTRWDAPSREVAFELRKARPHEA